MTGNFVGDLRFAFRAFSRAPRFTIPALIALALGIGATSAIFSVVRGVMLKPLPYRDPDRIVSIYETSRNQPRGIVASANFVEWRERNRSFEYLGMVGPSRLTIQLNGQPLEVDGPAARPLTCFQRSASQAAHGRTFTQDEDLEGNDAVILLSHEFWLSRLGGRSDVVGSTIDADGRKRTVVGIMPPQFTIEGRRADFYITYGWTTERLRAAIGRGLSHAVARLRDGVTLQQAADEMAAIAAQREKESAAAQCRAFGDRHADSRAHHRDDQAGADRCSPARSSSSCSSPASTSRTCCSRAARSDSASSDCEPRSAPIAAGCCGRC